MLRHLQSTKLTQDGDLAPNEKSNDGNVQCSGGRRGGAAASYTKGGPKVGIHDIVYTIVYTYFWSTLYLFHSFLMSYIWVASYTVRPVLGASVNPNSPSSHARYLLVICYRQIQIVGLWVSSVAVTLKW
jgi:hypothetical protein